MKILFYLLPLFFTTSLWAQKLQAGINGGLIDNCVHNNQQGSIFEDADHYQAHVISPDLSVKIIYVPGKYQYGLAMDYHTLSYKSSYIDEIWGKAFPYEMQFKDRDIPIKLFVNRVIRFRHIETYGGISVGYVFISSESNTVSTPEVKLTTQHPNSIAGGLQMGATYFITKRIGINAELTGEYINYPSLNTSDHSFPDYLGCNVLDKGSLSFPATIGIRYRF